MIGQLYNESFRNAWDDFVFNKAINATFLHSRKFYDHNILNASDDHSLLFHRDNKLIGLIPFNRIDVEGRIILNSFLRATYGGLIIGMDASVNDVLSMTSIIKEEAIKAGGREIIIRNSFRIFHDYYADAIDYALWYNGFEVKYRELEFAIPLTQMDAIRANYASDTKRSLKKANAALQVSETNDFDFFWKILSNNLQQKHAAAPTHTIQDFNKLLRNIGSNGIKLFAAYGENKMVAGIVCFLFKNKMIHAQYIASNYDFQQYRPLNLLIDYIAKWGIENGFSVLNLGMANEKNGAYINEGLSRFKEGFGARGVLRETMSCKLD